MSEIANFICSFSKENLHFPADYMLQISNLITTETLVFTSHHPSLAAKLERRLVSVCLHASNAARGTLGCDSPGARGASARRMPEASAPCASACVTRCIVSSW